MSVILLIARICRPKLYANYHQLCQQLSLHCTMYQKRIRHQTNRFQTLIGNEPVVLKSLMINDLIRSKLGNSFRQNSVFVENREMF